MKGKKEFTPAVPALVNLEELVPTTHLLRRLNDLLDFAFIGPMTDLLYCQTNGRPSIDPEVFFRMTLVSYLYGLPSDRVLCAELQFNLAYRWFCRFTLSDHIPDHSSMTRIRDRLGEKVFNDIFNQILELCREKKLLKYKGEVLFDSSHIQADACVDSIVKRTKETIPGVTRRKGAKLKSETYKSTTDEDAAMSGKKGVPRGLYYKVHNAVDAESRIILDPHVTTASVHDGKSLLSQIDSLKLNRNYDVESVYIITPPRLNGEVSRLAS